MPRMSLPKYQPPIRLGQSTKGPRVSLTFFVIQAVYVLVASSIIRALVLMPAFVSNDEKFPATKRIPSWVPGSHMSLRGNRIKNTSVVMVTKRR